MPAPNLLRLIATTNNDRGDLFTRLVSDLFYTLGYDNLRFDVHKTGREIDIEGEHRRETRRVIAECKAHAKKMGGAELNKLLGVLTRERSKGESVTGYFISLGGFTGPGIEQERNTDPQNRIITLDASDVIHELSKARILISLSRARERAGQCIESANLNEEIGFEGADLLGHSLGYIWAVFYGQGKERSHFALIHADGTPLTQTAANEVVEVERNCGGKLYGLTYLEPSPTNLDRKALAQVAIARYRQWLVAECGDIQLDGLPADTDLSALRMRLERLFVPLKIEFEKDGASDTVGVGEFLREHSRFSILAKPGGGKSTLLKRLAVAYADPDRLKESSDGLPDRAWLPLFLRCRELRDRVNWPIRELLGDLGRQAEMSREQVEAFRDLVENALRSGQALLLIDGLDEFADEGARKVFASHLRTFLAMFPNLSLVVTSREAGFRQIAGVIASVCEKTTMAPFDKADVYTLCKRWHAEVVGDNEAVRLESHALAGTIWQNRRIRGLAENPLMLTTLLVVRRNVGELPTKRVKLYRAAVDVLIRTWNVEGFAPLDEEETLARLSYVAVSMMQSGQQQIGRRQLIKLLKKAQKELEVELQFTDISPNNFIDRIEYRSSILMRTGHEETDDKLQEVFEFRHLTFQEYLAARGIVNEQYPGRDDEQDLTELLRPHFGDQAWQEVIPLAAVLADRKAAESLVKELIRTNAQETSQSQRRSLPLMLLNRCLQDEVQVTADTLQVALDQSARFSGFQSETDALLRGKFGSVLKRIIQKGFFGGNKDWEEYISAASILARYSLLEDKNSDEIYPADGISNIENALLSDDRVQQGLAALALMHLAFVTQFGSRPDKPKLDFDIGSNLSNTARLLGHVVNLLDLDDRPIALCISWCLCWTGQPSLSFRPDKNTILKLYRLWRESGPSELSRLAEWAFGMQPLYPRDSFDATDWGDCEELFLPCEDPTSAAKFIVAWYRGSGWSDEELLTSLTSSLGMEKVVTGHSLLTVIRVLVALGDVGRHVIDEWRGSLEPNIPEGPEINRILESYDLGRLALTECVAHVSKTV